MAKKQAGPDTTCAAYDAMLPVWQKIDTLMAGTEAMRAAGRAYLIQHDEETDTAYSERLSRTTLLNMLQMTVDAWVGKPFSDKVNIGEDVPELIKALFSNVDLQGNDINVFARNWFKDGLAKGMSHVLVDFPRPTPREDGQPRTLADDRAENLRPYLVHVKPENLYFGHAAFVNGVEVVSEIRIREEITEVVGWEEVTKTQLRIITPGVVRLYQLIKDPKTKKEAWRMIDQWAYDLPFVPVVTFYSDRQSFLQSKPPLIDLADLNIAHWQSSSDQTSILTVARFPILAVSGAIADDELTIGPNQWLHCPDPAGRFYYVEHNGKAIAAGRQHLLDLEETMAEYGATFLKKRPGGASATARALDSAEVTSPLEDMAIRFEAALQQAIQILGIWMKMKPSEVGSVTINTDFDYTTGTDANVIALQAARINGDISRPKLVSEFLRLGVLAPDFNEGENETELTKERAEQAAEEAKKAKQAAATAAANRPAPAAGGGGAGA